MNMQQLTLKLSELKLNQRAYCIGSKWNGLLDAFVLDKGKNNYEFFHIERGEKNILATFQSEDAACQHVLDYLSKNAGQRIHNVGIFFDREDKAQELVGKLNEAGISNKILEVQFENHPGAYYRVFIIGQDFARMRKLL